MSHDIQTMRNIYNMTKSAKESGQPIEENVMNILLNTITDDKIRNAKERFFKGYSAEDLFRSIYSLLPWTLLINGLGQEQFPERSKEEIQVPDYELTFEASKEKNRKRVLIEAKLVDNDKQTFVLEKYKYSVLKKYEEDANVPMLFAIYWRKKRMWTVNSIEAFEEKTSQYKLSFIKAFQNDLSSIFGDYTYVFDRRIFRKCQFSNKPNVKSEFPSIHEKYGRTISEAISADGLDYIKLNPFTAAVLDTFMDMEEISFNKISKSTVETVEQMVNVTYVFKLSTLIIAFIEKLYLYNNENMEINKNYITENAFGIIDNFRQDAGVLRRYIVPQDRNKTTSYLMKSQFEGTKIYNVYCMQHKEEEKIIICGE